MGVSFWEVPKYRPRPCFWMDESREFCASRLQDLDVVRQSAVRPDSIQPTAFTALRARAAHRVADRIDQRRQGEQCTKSEERRSRRFLGRATNLSRKQ